MPSVIEGYENPSYIFRYGGHDMSFNSDWEYNNQDYLKEQYEKKMAGELPDYPVRKIYCKGSGRVFYTNIETKKYCSYSLCGNRGYQKELKWRRKNARKDIICQTCGQPFTPKRSDAKFCCNACRQKAYRGSVTDAASGQNDHLQ